MRLIPAEPLRQRAAGLVQRSASFRSGFGCRCQVRLRLRQLGFSASVFCAASPLAICVVQVGDLRVQHDRCFQGFDDGRQVLVGLLLASRLEEAGLLQAGDNVVGFLALDQRRHGDGFARLCRGVNDVRAVGQVFDRLAGRQTEGKAGAHDAGERGHQNALGEIELGDGLLLLFRGHFALFRQARKRGHADAGQTDDDADQGHLAGPATKDGPEFVSENGGNQRAERSTIAQRDAHAQRHAEVTHGQPEREPAKAPHGSEEIRPPERGCGLLTQDAEDVVWSSTSPAPTGR